MTEPEEEPQEPLTTVEPLSTVEPEPETEGAQFLPENTGKNTWNQGESSKNVGKIRENHGILPIYHGIYCVCFTKNWFLTWFNTTFCNKETWKGRWHWSMCREKVYLLIFAHTVPVQVSKLTTPCPVSNRSSTLNHTHDNTHWPKYDIQYLVLNHELPASIDNLWQSHGFVLEPIFFHHFSGTDSKNRVKSADSRMPRICAGEEEEVTGASQKGWKTWREVGWHL